MADQTVVARAAGFADRQADHPLARLGGSQSGGPQSVFRIPALETGYVEDLRLALEDLGLSDAQIKLSIRGALSYRGIWGPYKEWCCDHNRYAISCVSIDSFVYSSAANQLAEFLADRSGTDHVGPVSTLCNYRSCISKFFSILFNVNLTDSFRVKAVIDGYGKDHPSQTR